MKKVLFLLITSVAMIFSSCDKDYYVPSCDGPNCSGQSSDIKAEGVYTWPGRPIPQEVLSLEKVAVAGYTNVYDHKFAMHLDGSQIDPSIFGIGSFSIPHVGPKGMLTYENVSNDATYTITHINGSYVYYTIRSEAGHTLKYNIAINVPGAGYVWFLKKGLTEDDGKTNIIEVNL